MPCSSTSRLATDAGLGAPFEAAPTLGDPGALDGVIESVVTRLSDAASPADIQLYREVEALANYIKAVRSDIAELRADDIKGRHIPMATDELDAVVSATAAATDVILGGMEEIERLAGGMPPDIAAPVGDIVIKVYEACSFQDITGQRISKVVKALRHIESKVDALLVVFGGDLRPATAAQPEVEDEVNLLNGPALPAGANSQADIDALLASFD